MLSRAQLLTATSRKNGGVLFLGFVLLLAPTCGVHPVSQEASVTATPGGAEHGDGAAVQQCCCRERLVEKSAVQKYSGASTAVAVIPELLDYVF